jgi:phenylacetate-coenzyme A ligase PaaK-like adenylate-forming protein
MTCENWNEFMAATFWHGLKFAAKSNALQRLASAPAEKIAHLQRERLQKIVRLAKDRAPYYRDKLAGLNPERVELADIPSSTKTELMAHFADALTVHDVRRGDVERFLLDDHNLGSYFLGKFVVTHTSGSQGRPLLLIYPKGNIELLFALQAARGTKRTLGPGEAARKWFSPARVASISLKPGFYPSSTAFEYLPEGIKPYLKVLRLSAGEKHLVERLNEFRPTHITGYASALHELARQIEAGQLNLKPELEQVTNISECLLPQVREEYERVFGAPVLDDYAMGECLFLSNGCLTSGGMHVNADWAILEVVDKNNRPVASGEQGAKVLLTNLANWAQPLIRYEVGDLVTMATEPCGCGSKLPLIARVEGRSSELLQIETGAGPREISAGLVQVAVESLLDVREYQLVQTERNHVRVLLEPLPDVGFDLGRAEEAVRRQLEANGIDSHRVLEFEIVTQLNRPDEGKFKRVVFEKDAAAVAVS